MNKRKREKEKEIEIRQIIFSLDIALRCSSFSLKLYARCSTETSDTHISTHVFTLAASRENEKEIMKMADINYFGPIDSVRLASNELNINRYFMQNRVTSISMEIHEQRLN